MSLLFPYAQLPARLPAVALGGRKTRPRALVETTLVGLTNTFFAKCLLDTGADDTIFPEKAALPLGLDLTNAPLGEVTGVAGTAPAPVRYAQVLLRITDGREFCEWQGWVGFTTAPLRQPLLGFAGCLQFFDADFRGGREEVEVKMNHLFAGRAGKFPS